MTIALAIFLAIAISLVVMGCGFYRYASAFGQAAVQTIDAVGATFFGRG